MKRWALLALVLFATPAAAQSDLVTSSMDLQAQDLEGAFIDRYNLRADCGSDLVARGDDYFKFAESAFEFGCAAVSLELEVPQGAEELRVAFGINRGVDSVARAGYIGANFLQQFLIDDGRSEPSSRTAFPADADPQATAKSMQAEHRLASDASEVTVQWSFDDIPPSDTTLRYNNAGNGWKSEVRDIQLAFTGLVVPNLRSALPEQHPDRDTLVTVERISFDLSKAHFDDLQPTIRLSFQDSPQIIDVRGPGGPVEPGLVAISGDAGTTIWTLDGRTLTDDGTYTIAYRHTGALVADSALTPMAGTGLFLPILGAGYASYQYAQAERQARQAHRKANPAMRATLIGIGVLYATILAFLFSSGEYWNLLISPLPVVGVGYFLMMIGITAAFVVVAIVGTRRQARAIEHEVDVLKAIQNKLEKSNQDLEYFAYIASHDLQEPLRTISGFSQLLRQRYGEDLPEPAQRYLDKTISGSQRLQVLIGDLLAFSRITTHDRTEEPVELGKVIDDEVAQIQRLVKDKKATIECGPMPTVTGDAGQLGQVFANLIRNAIRYAHPDRAPAISIQAKRDGSCWDITVADNGVGIPEEQFERIFVIFQRLAPRTTDSGTGIGLSIVQRIMERHGGSVAVDSQVGVGSTFTLRFPTGVMQ